MNVRPIVLVALTTALLGGAGGRRKLWDLDLSKFTNRQVDMAGQVWGISFSPDESKIAVGFGSRLSFDARPRHVAIVPVDDPKTPLREFDLITKGSPLPSAKRIAWSPSGTIVVVRTQPPFMLQLGSETPCTFSEESEFGGFLSEDRIVLYRRGDRRAKAEIQILMPNCSVADSWLIDGPADVLDTSPEQGLLAIQTFLEPGEKSTVELVATRKHNVTQRWTRNSVAAHYGRLLFSDQGRLVCGAFRGERQRDPHPACWDTQTGAMTAENDKVVVDEQAINSAGGELVAVTDCKFISHQGGLWAFLDMENSYSVPRRQLIWNVRTGEEVASWGRLSSGELQQSELLGRDLEHARTIKTRVVLTLSPTGRYVAEGGSGAVSVYAVQP